MKFVMKSTTVEAMQWASADDAHAIVEWAAEVRPTGDAVGPITYDEHTSGPSNDAGEDWGRLEIETRAGMLTATPRDWVVYDAQGEFRVYGPRAFSESADPAQPAST